MIKRSVKEEISKELSEKAGISKKDAQEIVIKLAHYLESKFVDLLTTNENFLNKIASNEKFLEFIAKKLDFNLTRRLILATGTLGALTLGMGTAGAKLVLTDKFVELDGQKYYPAPVGAYNVIVMKNDANVWAEDCYGNTIAEGEKEVDDARVLQSAINKGVGKVIIKNNLTLKEPVYVWGGVCLSVEDGVYIKNDLPDDFTPCLIFKPYSSSDRLAIDCNNKSGILIGDEETVNNIKMEYVHLWNVGKSYDNNLGSQTGIKFRGHNIHIDRLNITGGNVVCEFFLTSDCYIDTVLIVDFVTGIKFTACEHVFLDKVDLDSGRHVGVQIDSSHDINIFGTIWVNNTQYEGYSLVYGAQIGEYSSSSPNTALYLKLKFLRHGGTALKISNTKDSVFDIEISNTDLYTESPEIKRGIEFGEGLSGDIVIKSERKIDAPIKIVGVPYGKLLIPEIGYNKGTVSVTGDGVKTTFTVDIEHGLVKDTLIAKITLDREGTVDKIYLVDKDEDGFKETIRAQITFATAPADGEKVPIYWYAEVV